MAAARTPRTRRRRTRTKDTRRRCLGEMARALADGHGPTEVARAAAARYGIALSSAWHDLAEVRRIWAEEAERQRGTEAGRLALGESLVRREELFRLALRNGDVDLAFEVEQDRCRLLGLYSGQGAFPEPIPGPGPSLAQVPTDLLRKLELLLAPATPSLSHPPQPG
ncbi:hypothetical protein [Gemmata sp.]|uniref:hypothetical protein n=1 Tax=Gemmata sp. TaxID=1914242 RepID=UPI003F72CBAE